MTALRVPRSQAPPRLPVQTILTATAASVVALLLLVLIGELGGHLLLVPPMAASMALVAGAPALPLSQPRNVVLGQSISAVVGVVVGAVGHSLWAAAVAGGLSLGVMLLVRAPHSPAAATAVLGVSGAGHVGDQVSFVVCVCAASCVLVAVGWMRGRLGSVPYPKYWW